MESHESINVYSPVARINTVRALLAIADNNNWKMKQFDVATAYLIAELPRDAYIEQPKGFDDGSARVCKLNKSVLAFVTHPKINSTHSWVT